MSKLGEGRFHDRDQLPISLLLVVASWTLSHVALSTEEADDASWLSIVVRCDAGRGSVQQMSVLKKCPGWSRGRGTFVKYL